MMGSADSVNVAVTLHQRDDDNYVRGCAALYASLRTHTRRPLLLHVIHDETLSAASRQRLAQSVGGNDSIAFIDVNRFPPIAAQGRAYRDQPCSPAPIWRIWLPELCPVERVISLDADLIFLFDVGELWDVELGGCSVAACLRGRPWTAEYHRLVATPPEKYFRSGVMLMDLGSIRRDARFMQQREEFLRVEVPKTEKIAWLPEQSLFNFFFSASCLPLDLDLCNAARSTLPSAQAAAGLTRLRDPRKVVLDLRGWENESPLASFYWSHLLLTAWQPEAFAFLAGRQPPS